MSNVLGELFGDIAAAIREKTGDTATMKPAEFPDKIASIEAGGGSGDTSSVGWLKPEPSFPSTVTMAYNAFVMNDKLYAFAYSDGQAIFRLDGDAWTLVCTLLTKFSYPSTADICVVADGAHLFGGEDTLHLVFDGESVTELTSLPSRKTYPNGFVEDGYIHYISTTNAVYKFDGSAWVDTGITVNDYFYNMANVGGAVYATKSTRVYTYSHGVFSQIGETPIVGTLVEVNGNIYIVDASNNNKSICKLQDGQIVELDYKSIFSSYAWTGYNGRLYNICFRSNAAACGSMELP